MKFRKYILLAGIVFLILGTIYLISIAPYHIYNLTLTEGVNTRFLKMNPVPPHFYDGAEADPIIEDKNFKQAKYIFAPIHLKNTQMTLPLNYPGISFIPRIKIESGVVKLGAQFIDLHQRSLFEFMLEKEFRFETNLVNQKLYFLPYFRNYIDNKDQNHIWRDIFIKRLSLPSNNGKSFYQSMKILNQYSYRELVYNLFIINNRVNVLPEEFQKINYDTISNVGIVTISRNEFELIERVYLLNQGFIYPITMRTNLNSQLAIASRDRFIQELKFKATSKDSIVQIYSEYQNLKYSTRIDEKGMIHLYSAWSHDIDNKEFIRVIITFLERGKSTIKYLRPFYEYAYKKFGSSFSGDRDFLLETSDEKLKRSMKEELENEVKNSDLINNKNQVNIMTDDEKIKSNLLKAKDKKFNSDDKLKELSIE